MKKLNHTDVLHEDLAQMIGRIKDQPQLKKLLTDKAIEIAKPSHFRTVTEIQTGFHAAMKLHDAALDELQNLLDNWYNDETTPTTSAASKVN